MMDKKRLSTFHRLYSLTVEGEEDSDKASVVSGTKVAYADQFLESMNQDIKKIVPNYTPGDPFNALIEETSGLGNNKVRALKCNSDGENILHIASQNCNYQDAEYVKYIVKSIRSSEVNISSEIDISGKIHIQDAVNTKNAKDETPLHLAAKSGNIELFEYLYCYCKALPSRTADGKEVLHYAAISGNYELLFFIINENNKDNVKKNKFGSIDDEDELGNNPLYYVTESRKKECIKFLIELGVKYKRNIKGETSLHSMARDYVTYEDYNAILNLILKNMACKYESEMFGCNNEGEAPLHIAVQCKNKRFIEGIFNYKNNINVDDVIDIKDEDGKTPLDYAIINNDYDCCDLLLRNNAKVINSHLCFASQYGDLELFKLLLGKTLTYDKKRYIGIKKRTIFHYTAINGNVEVLQYLFSDEFIREFYLKKRKDEVTEEEIKEARREIFCTKDKYGRTMLMSAACADNKKCLKYLFDECVQADQNLIEDLREQYKSIVACGALVGSKECVECLLSDKFIQKFYPKQKVEEVIQNLLSEQDAEGKTILACAACADSKECLEYLLSDKFIQKIYPGQEMKKALEQAIYMGSVFYPFFQKNEKSHYGDTMFHFAARDGSYECLKYLFEFVQNGVPNREVIKNILSMENNKRETILELATLTGNMKCISFLIEEAYRNDINIFGYASIDSDCEERPVYLFKGILEDSIKPSFIDRPISKIGPFGLFRNILNSAILNGTEHDVSRLIYIAKCSGVDMMSFIGIPNIDGYSAFDRAACAGLEIYSEVYLDVIVALSKKGFELTGELSRSLALASACWDYDVVSFIFNRALPAAYVDKYMNNQLFGDNTPLHLALCSNSHLKALKDEELVKAIESRRKVNVCSRLEIVKLILDPEHKIDFCVKNKEDETPIDYVLNDIDDVRLIRVVKEELDAQHEVLEEELSIFKERYSTKHTRCTQVMNLIATGFSVVSILMTVLESNKSRLYSIIRVMCAVIGCVTFILACCSLFYLSPKNSKLEDKVKQYSDYISKVDMKINDFESGENRLVKVLRERNAKESKTSASQKKKGLVHTLRTLGSSIEKVKVLPEKKSNTEELKLNAPNKRIAGLADDDGVLREVVVDKGPVASSSNLEKDSTSRSPIRSSSDIISKEVVVHDPRPPMLLSSSIEIPSSLSNLPKEEMVERVANPVPNRTLMRLEAIDIFSSYSCSSSITTINSDVSSSFLCFNSPGMCGQVRKNSSDSGSRFNLPWVCDRRVSISSGSHLDLHLAVRRGSSSLVNIDEPRKSEVSFCAVTSYLTTTPKTGKKEKIMVCVSKCDDPESVIEEEPRRRSFSAGNLGQRPRVSKDPSGPAIKEEPRTRLNSDGAKIIGRNVRIPSIKRCSTGLNFSGMNRFAIQSR